MSWIAGLWLSIAFSSCASPSAPARRSVRLEANQKATVTVMARAKVSPTGILFEKGARYAITVNRTDRWFDFYMPTTAAGWGRRWFQSAGSKKPIPDAPWCALVGKIGNGEAFVVGTSWFDRSSADGELHLFANDHPSLYWNNWGKLEVAIEKVESPSNPAN